MTTATTKTRVETKWPVSKTQEEFAHFMATTWQSAYNTLSKYGESAVNEFETAARRNKVEYYKSLGVKTPLELVKAIAELESNIFGSKIEIWGDERTAHLTYDSCGMWNAFKKYGKLTAEQEEKMGTCFQTSIEALAREFGFKGEVKFEEPCATVTFSK